MHWSVDNRRWLGKCENWTINVQCHGNGARYKESYYCLLIGGRIRAFYWYQEC